MRKKRKKIKSKMVKLECKNCGIDFWKTSKEARLMKRHETVFCSFDCYVCYNLDRRGFGWKK